MIQVEYHEKVLLAKLDRSITNAINLDLLNNLADILNKAKNDPNARSFLLGSSNEKFFSIGFDIPQLFELSKKDFKLFYQTFNQVCISLYTFPKPTIAAMTGHAIAGGCILALCCDYRTIAEGRKLMGLNEIKLAVPIPYVADCILRNMVGVRYAREIMDTGEFYQPEQLFQMGMVDQILPLDQVLTNSIEKARSLGSLPQKAYQMIKRNRIEMLEKQILKNLEKKEQHFIECWYSDEARECLKEAIKKF